MLTKIEKKMTAKFAPIRVQDYNGKAGFILSDGFVIVTNHHAALCRMIHYSLSKVIQAGMCRYTSHIGTEGGVIAFEYARLTAQQKTTINFLLRTDDFYTVVTTKTIVSKFLPIRKIKF